MVPWFSLSPLGLGKALKGLLPFVAVSVGQEMSIKGKGLAQAEPFHQGEGGAVHKAVGLIRKALDNPPGRLQVHRLNGLDWYLRFSKGFPKRESRRSTQMGIKQGPGFSQNKISG